MVRAGDDAKCRKEWSPPESWQQLHVAAGAAGGEGTEERPFGTLTAAVRAASGQPTAIYMEPGRYRVPR
ncbi:MAG: hypothetical protein ABEN55_17625, partial [Bradymonadaceae bacterium]